MSSPCYRCTCALSRSREIIDPRQNPRNDTHLTHCECDRLATQARVQHSPSCVNDGVHQRPDSKTPSARGSRRDGQQRGRQSGPATEVLQPELKRASGNRAQRTTATRQRAATHPGGRFIAQVVEREMGAPDTDAKACVTWSQGLVDSIVATRSAPERPRRLATDVTTGSARCRSTGSCMRARSSGGSGWTWTG